MLWSMATGKAPRPDGFHAEFYKNHWEMLDWMCTKLLIIFIPMTSCLVHCANINIVSIPKRRTP